LRHNALKHFESKARFNDQAIPLIASCFSLTARRRGREHCPTSAHAQKPGSACVREYLISK
jgi:hypothetical protein